MEAGKQVEAANSAGAMDLAKNLDIVQDVKVTLSMELGRTKLTIRELLQLSQGSVVELDRMVDEHMDVLVNGTLVAHGEVVVIDDKFGIRLTDIVQPMERVKPLK
jgi:flagellar motor switch protein FliN/FliY